MWVWNTPGTTLSGVETAGAEDGAGRAGIMTMVAWDTDSTGGGTSLTGGSLATVVKEARGEVNCVGPASKSRERVGAPNRQRGTQNEVRGKVHEKESIATLRLKKKIFSLKR